MAESSGNPLSRTARSFLETLKSSYLVMLVTAVFALDLFIPDLIPFVDEIVLFVMTVLLARWKSRQREEAEDELKPPPKDVTPERSEGRSRSLTGPTGPTQQSIWAEEVAVAAEPPAEAEEVQPAGRPAFRPPPCGCASPTSTSSSPAAARSRTPSSGR